jgi:hypothetical protein
VDRQIAELLDRSTQELRVAWRQLHRTGPPQGLSRDLLIRALVHQLQERAAGGASRALRRRLQTLAGEFEKRSASFDPGIVPKTGTTLVRQWRGHPHTVLVRGDGFEYEGPHYRSLTVIAERITGAHWRRIACSCAGIASSIDPVMNLQYPRGAIARTQLRLSASTVSPAPACLCRPRPLVPARTTAKTAASRSRKANSRERQVRT